MSADPSEKLVLQNVVADLRADGFDVFIEPSGRAIPSFLAQIRPDAIAIRGERKLIIEVLRQGATAERRLEVLRHALANQDEWELQVHWISSSNEVDVPGQVSREAIGQTLGDAQRLVNEGQLAPALLTCWAALEALARRLLPDKFQRPQTPGRLVEVLAAEGHLTPGEADLLRSLAKLRNAFIHGGLQVEVRGNDLTRFIAILETLSRLRAPAPIV
jgi:uncharacterized protein YutE (UPF0331/DUF86 family)